MYIRKYIILFIIIGFLVIGFSINSYSQTNDNNDNNNNDDFNINNLSDNDIDENNNNSDNLNDDNSNDNSESNDLPLFNLGGYVRANYYFGFDGSFEDGFDETGYNRIGTTLQLRLDGYIGNFGYFFSATNFEYDVNMDNRNGASITSIKNIETYIDMYIFQFLTIRAGNQIVVWGKSDGVKTPTDNINPIDYSVSSLEYEDFKLAVTALSFKFYLLEQKLEFIWIPIFQPTILPAQFNEMIQGFVNEVKYPDLIFNNSDIAVQISGYFESISYAVSFMYAYDDMFDFELVAPNTLNLIYNRLMIPGFDFDISIGEILIKGSTALFITEDWEGEKDNIKNSYIDYLLGLDWIIPEVSLSFMAGQNIVLNYTEPESGMMGNEIYLYGLNQLDKIRYKIILSIQKSLLTGNALTLELYSQISANEELNNWDVVVNFKAYYEPITSMVMAFGLLYTRQYLFVSYDPLGDGLIREYTDVFGIITEFKYSF